MLKASLQRSGFFLDDEQERKFVLYLKELRKLSGRINLTSLKDTNDIIENLFINSLLFSTLFPSGNSLKLLDIGSGAGFPGLPLKILLPETRTTLLEASQKKTAFLKHICRTLDMKSVECLAERSESLSREKKRAETFDIIVTRGTGAIKKLEKTVYPLLKKDGVFITQKGLSGKGEGAEKLSLVETTVYKERGFVLMAFTK